MWQDYFLKASDAATLAAVWPPEWLGEAGEDYAVDVVGQLFTGGTVSAVEGAGVAPTAVPGWHVNVRLREGMVLPASLQPFVITPPAVPKRVFA